MKTVIEKNGKKYEIEKNITGNRWLYLFTVYEITDDNKTLFKGKYKAPDLETVINEL